jgi:tetratricopeptide (TPR) repeat protein
MKMSKSAAFAVLLLCAGAPSALARPDADDAWAHCGGSDQEVRIESCTAIIQSGQETPRNLALAYGLRALANLQNGATQDAIADYTAAMDLKATTGDVTASMFIGRGAAYAAIGDIDHAIGDETAALGLKPDDPAALVNLGNAYLGKGDFARAADIYTKALAIQPDARNAANNRAYALLKLKRYGEAIADYDTALKATPDNAQALYGRGLAKRAVGDVAGAELDIAAAEKVAPGVGKAFAP